MVDIKQKLHESKAGKESIHSKGHKKVQLLYQRTEELLGQLSFIKPFGYPVDHFAMRREYDEYKSHTEIKGQKMKNDVLFKRRVFEDGAQNPNHTKSDRFFRALINTLGIEFKNQTAIISESFSLRL